MNQADKDAVVNAINSALASLPVEAPAPPVPTGPDPLQSIVDGLQTDKAALQAQIASAKVAINDALKALG